MFLQTPVMKRKRQIMNHGCKWLLTHYQHSLVKYSISQMTCPCQLFPSIALTDVRNSILIMIFNKSQFDKVLRIDECLKAKKFKIGFDRSGTFHHGTPQHIKIIVVANIERFVEFCIRMNYCALFTLALHGTKPTWFSQPDTTRIQFGYGTSCLTPE